MPGRLRVATWNVHSCIGSDGRHDPDRIRRIVRTIGADIVALQEVDSRIDGHDGFEDLGAALGPDRAHCRTLQTPDGDYGHMLLSRWPLRRVQAHDISVAGREPRGIVEAETLSPFGPIRVIGAHFGLRRRERRLQTATLRAIVDPASDGAAIVAGDFNELRRRSATHRALSPHFHGTTVFATFPSWRPLVPLDRIWCRLPLRSQRSRVLRSARSASDHLPLIADLEWIGP